MIGATNRPDLIDPAVLRTGRMDKIIYIPPPDHEARKALFRLHLEGRPVDDDIDLVALAGETEGRVASDIAFLANEAARDAYTEKEAHYTKALAEGHPTEPSLCDGPAVGQVCGDEEALRRWRGRGRPVGFQPVAKTKTDG